MLRSSERDQNAAVQPAPPAPTSPASPATASRSCHYPASRNRAQDGAGKRRDSELGQATSTPGTQAAANTAVHKTPRPALG